MTMQPPFQFHFPEEIWGGSVFSNTYPSLYNYAISIAKPILTTTANGTFLRQCYSGNDLAIELWSFDIQQEGYFDLSVIRPIAPIGISLKNKISLHVGNLEWKNLADKKYRIMFLPAGKRRIKVFKGITAFLLLMPPLYLYEAMTSLSAQKLSKVISPKTQMVSEPLFMKDCLIDITLKRTLKRLEQLDFSNGHFTANLFSYTIRIISHYDERCLRETYATELSYAAKAARNVREYIQQNLKEPGVGNIKRLCRLFNISDKPLKREFQLLTSQSIPDYIKEQRLQISLNVSANSSLSVAEIALIVGYSETSNFVRDFKKRFGLTPKQCQKKEQNSGLR
ncbi:MAG: AraC family transcriptional regulator [Chitinophagaceae bacterium]|nr:MAG: AraC family transcriptional regulator [Chitinophagaceae bacterium]